MDKMKIILASKSPRRKALLEEAGLQVIVDPSNADERSIKDTDLKNLVLRISELKAKTVAERHKNSIIIAADTMVFYDHKEIGQPEDKDDARKIIKALIGKTHEVGTGITIINTATGKILQDFKLSKVTLNDMSDAKIWQYLDTEQYIGKAGAYNIRDKEFKPFIKSYEGDYENVAGLPVKKVLDMIKRIGEK
jgi:septum formation protein